MPMPSRCIMAVIWKKGAFKVYATPNSQPPTNEDIELAKEYDKELKEKIDEITVSLKKKGFFDTQNKMKKWHMLGEELQFLDNLEIRQKCDPNLENTWKALYDIAPHLAPSKSIPTDKERVFGKRNHFYRCYLLGKIPWNQIKDIAWANWDDIYMSLSPYMWKDSERLLEWVMTRASTKKGVTRSRLRKVLKALRRVIGQKGKVEMDTTVLSKKELYKLLDQELEKITT